MCEEILLSSGLVDEAYERYGVRANHGGTYLATFRAVAKKYPQKRPRELLADLAARRPARRRSGSPPPRKWVSTTRRSRLRAAARAIRRPSPEPLATSPTGSPPSPSSGLLALRWLAEGYGYEVTSADVWSAYKHTMKADSNHGCPDETLTRLRRSWSAKEPGYRQDGSWRGTRPVTASHLCGENMRIRAVIDVGGPPESGKTLLVEAMLRSLDAWTWRVNPSRHVPSENSIGLLTWILHLPRPSFPYSANAGPGTKPSFRPPFRASIETPTTAVASPITVTIARPLFCVLHLLSMEIHPSARRHDIAEADISHAYEHSMAWVQLDDVPLRYLLAGPDGGQPTRAGHPRY